MSIRESDLQWLRRERDRFGTGAAARLEAAAKARSETDKAEHRASAAFLAAEHDKFDRILTTLDNVRGILNARSISWQGPSDQETEFEVEYR